MTVDGQIFPPAECQHYPRRMRTYSVLLEMSKNEYCIIKVGVTGWLIRRAKLFSLISLNMMLSLTLFAVIITTCFATAPPVVSSYNLTAYLGLWYQIADFKQPYELICNACTRKLIFKIYCFICDIFRRDLWYQPQQYSLGSQSVQ